MKRRITIDVEATEVPYVLAWAGSHGWTPDVPAEPIRCSTCLGQKCERCLLACLRDGGLVVVDMRRR